MKSGVSLMLIVCLAGSTAPLAAQEPTAAGPIARAAMREAVPGRYRRSSSTSHAKPARSPNGFEVVRIVTQQKVSRHTS